MSDQKTLGQVAWEDFWSSVNRPVKWSECPNEHAAWERAAEAIKSAEGNTQEGIEQSQTTWRAGYERGLAEGANEERERIAKAMLARDAGGMTPMLLSAVIPDYVQWIRTCGKP